MTVINGLPVKNKMKNVFLENHVFTRFNLCIQHTAYTGPGVLVRVMDSHGMNFTDTAQLIQ